MIVNKKCAANGAAHFLLHLNSKGCIVHCNSNALVNWKGGGALAGDGRRKTNLHTDCRMAGK